MTCFGKLSILKSHVLCQHTQRFGISSKLQEVCCLLAQGYVFAEAEELLCHLLGVRLCAKQIQGVSEHYGEELETQAEGQAAGEAAPPVLSLKEEQDTVYAMVDGSMILSREAGWKEVKMGRLFPAAARVAVQEGRHQLMQSLYVCHLGGHKKFLKKFEAYCEPYRHKIFVADGAKWIWNWVEDAYPEAVQILDFYHALEKLGVYATLRCGAEKEGWMENQKQRLRRGEVADVLVELKEAVPLDKETRKAWAEVISYYENNQGRMQYKTYLEKGYLIGSGAIESAHRNVLQQRLKLSGQRWSLKGAQQIATLRACKKSNQWKNLILLIKSAA